MSFREKSAWIALLAYGGVFGAYFIALWQAWDPANGQPLSIGPLVAAMFAFVGIVTVLTIVAALLNPKAANAPADEREKLIELKAERAAAYTLSTGVLLSMTGLLLGFNGYLIANALLASLVAAELVKAGWQIASFRMGV
ncbi:MAG: hypothetical protein AB7Q23_11790 [Hyphomonadaceae bacterium]